MWGNWLLRGETLPVVRVVTWSTRDTTTDVSEMKGVDHVGLVVVYPLPFIQQEAMCFPFDV